MLLSVWMLVELSLDAIIFHGEEITFPLNGVSKADSGRHPHAGVQPKVRTYRPCATDSA